ncbi:MAG: hypothetical protein V4504_01365 [Patescibacteria group bacterium]
MENFFKKSIKKLATGAAFVGALAGSPEKADGQVIGVEKNNKKLEVPAYHTTDPNDPRLKAYKDSLKSFNMFNNNFSKNLSKDTIGPFDSKVKITRTRKPLDKEADSFFKKDKIQPIGWINKESYNPDYLTGTYSYDLSNDLTNKPTTDFIEDKVDRGEIKKVFPKITDKIINEEIEKTRKELNNSTNSFDKPFVLKNISSDKIEDGRYYTNDLSKGYKAEEISNIKIKKEFRSLPMYKKPVQEVVLDKKIQNLKIDIEQKILEKEIILPKGPLKYATVDKAGQKYFFMTDSVGGTVRSVTERAYQNDYKDLPEVKYEDLKRVQEGK